ncbi:hypothetical protein AAFP35_25720 [Gordonia sp. CPCC 206044]|uniref:hypothetical protein n=1 Tax=Gordonia sp. CPCC 206044 TaxID=3140793 RepID=UPI003AF4042C
MKPTRKLTVLVAATAAILMALFTMQTTGVLASWQDSVWGSSEFGRAELLMNGYARGTVAAVSGEGGNQTAQSVERSHTNPGDSGTVDGSVSHGVSTSYNYDAAGSVQAQFTQTEGAHASSFLGSLNIGYTVFYPSVAHLNAPIANSVTCPVNGTPAITAPTGTLRIRGYSSIAIPVERTLTIPAAGGTSTTGDIGSAALAVRVNATLSYDETITSTSAVSELTLTFRTTWAASSNTNTITLLKAECGLDGYAPATHPVSTGPTTESDPDDGRVDEESVEGESSGNHDTGQDEATTDTDSEDEQASPAPIIPTAIALNRPFDIVATDGRFLGTAVLHEIDNSATTSGGPTTVAVRMTVTTSDETGTGRLSRITADDFRQLVGTNPTTVTAATTDNGVALPQTLQANQTYTGWIGFTVNHGVTQARWQPHGTAGFTITLPAPTVTAPPTTAPETSAPEAPAPETTAPETPAPDSPVPDTATPTPDTSTPETPVPESSEAASTSTPKPSDTSARSASDE